MVTTKLRTRISYVPGPYVVKEGEAILDME